jgi:hypothetical protein
LNLSLPDQDVLSKQYSALRTGKTLLDGDNCASDSDADGDDLFTVKNIEYPAGQLDMASQVDLNAPSKRSLRRIRAHQKSKVSTCSLTSQYLNDSLVAQSHAVYDDDGNLLKPFERVAVPDSFAEPSVFPAALCAYVRYVTRWIPCENRHQSRADSARAGHQGTHARQRQRRQAGS